MFNFAGSEFALIAIVALIFIGPKDLPVAVKAVTDIIKKARRMAGEFQTHVDEMVRDTELADVRNQINEIRNFDFRGEVERAVDGDGSLRRSLNEDPFRQGVTTTTAAATKTGTEAAPLAVGEAGTLEIERPAEADAPPAPPPEPARPAFVPPGVARPMLPASISAEPAPAFIPPAAARAHAVRY